MKLLLDTCVLIKYLRGEKKAQDFIDKVKLGEVIAYISKITEVEVFHGVYRGNWKPFDNEIERMEKTLALLELFLIEEISRDITMRGGEILGLYGHQMGGDMTNPDRYPIADAIVASTAVTLNVVLLSTNKHHFKQLHDNKVLIFVDYQETDPQSLISSLMSHT